MRDCPACAESNPERARFCLACGHPLPADNTGHPSDIRRTVSVVFADLAGSTVLGESLDPEPLRGVTGRYFDTMRAAVERHEGTVEKFIGDAVVAVFGVPRVREDDAIRAVRAAADMRASLATLNIELQRDYGVQLQMRIGVNTGEVVLGDARAGGSLATGDAVNVAARLEQAAAPGEILIGDATHRLVRSYVDTAPVEPLSLKGKAEPVPAWRVVGVGATASGRPATTTFVGRDHQLRVLDDAYRRVVEERTCQLVTVLGVAGMGKTRLADEFTATVADATVMQGHCLSYGEGATYWPLREAVFAAAGLTGDESVEEVDTALRNVLGVSPDADNVVARLLALVGFHKDEAVPEDMAWAVRTFLEALARQRPVILVVDDLHWAEPGLLDLIEHVADWSRDASIMLLGLARPEFFDNRPMWGGGKLNATSMLLSALDESASANLIQKHDLPSGVQRRIIDAAGGNPLFAEQLVALLVDEGHAVADGDTVTWRGDIDGDVPLTMPPSVAALLAARIDRLDQEERTLLGCASVVGAIFYVEAVSALADTDIDRTRDLLAGLVRRELLRANASDLSGFTAYRFLHALVRDAAYDGLSKRSRAEWHERFADWLDTLDGDAVPDEIVGHHLASAWTYRTQLGPPTDHTRALGRRAAERLAAAAARLELSDVAAAAALNARAVDLLEPDNPLRFECLLALGSQQLELGEVPKAQELFLAAAESPNPRLAELAKVMQCRANAFTAEHRIEDSERIVHAALERFREWQDDRGLATSYLVLSEHQAFRGVTTASLEALKLSMQHAEAAGDAGGLARARGLVGVFYLFGPTPAEEVIATLDALLESSGNDPRVRAEVEQVNCVMHAMCGRFDVARAMGADCRRHLAEVGHGLFLANLAQSTAHVAELAGDLDEAEREYEWSTAALLRLGESAYLSTVAGLHARLLARRGKWAEAAAARELAHTHGSLDDVMTVSLVLQAEALLAVHDGDAVGAREALRFVGLEDPAETPDIVGDAYLVAADVEQSLGDVDAERAHLEAALSAFERKGNAVRAAQVRARLAPDALTFGQ